LGEVDFETKSGKGRRNSGTFSYSEFQGGLKGAKTGFLSPTVREIFGNENPGMKNREIWNSPLQSASSFSANKV
jgi:hypothetical protein